MPMFASGYWIDVSRKGQRTKKSREHTYQVRARVQYVLSQSTQHAIIQLTHTDTPIHPE